MTRAEARDVLTRHLVLCDAASKGNAWGNTVWRDTAAAIRTLLADDDRDAPSSRNMTMGRAA